MKKFFMLLLVLVLCSSVGIESSLAKGKKEGGGGLPSVTPGVEGKQAVREDGELEEEFKEYLLRPCVWDVLK